VIYITPIGPGRGNFPRHTGVFLYEFTRLKYYAPRFAIWGHDGSHLGHKTTRRDSGGSTPAPTLAGEEESKGVKPPWLEQ